MKPVIGINGSTRVFGIFGDPVSQSLSPAMHNAAFKALGLDHVYVPFHVSAKEPGALKNAIKAIRALDIKGVNITIPHKVAAMEFLDEVSLDARASGSVNTVINRDKRLYGCNTDGEGFLIGIKKETGFNPRGKNIIILGAGGAARSIIFSLLKKNAGSVVVANRTEARAEALAM
ncbi:MAG: shikimate dehydrogenase [Deltaproteobacteria bacterium]